LPQIGAVELGNQEDVTAAKKFYQDYVNKLSPTHFITFGESGASVLRRLLKRPLFDLSGFTITHIQWDDEITHPPYGIIKYSQDSYKIFAGKLRACFEVSP
jgi:hypothetical protein